MRYVLFVIFLIAAASAYAAFMLAASAACAGTCHSVCTDWGNGMVTCNSNCSNG